MALFCGGLSLFGTSARALTIPPLSGPVIDQVGVIDSQTRSELEALLRQLNERGTLQLQILVLKSLEGETIESASIQIVDQYKLGSAAKDNGVLFLIVPDERKMRIEVGQGLEGELTDIASKRIISDVVRPFFKAGRYSEGTRAGALSIIAKADPEALGASASEWASSGSPMGRFTESGEFLGFTLRQIFELVFFLMFVSFTLFGRMFQSKLGRRRGFAGGGPWIGYPSSGSSGWGGGSSSGGWGGGGGGFSGGGSSGSW